MDTFFSIRQIRITDSFDILGHTFNGLHEVIAAVELNMCSESLTQNKPCPASPEAYSSVEGIHILCDYEPYPIFDSSDSLDNRSFQNFFFQDKPFEESDIAVIRAIPYSYNYQKIGKDLQNYWPAPAIYYRGDGDTMLISLPADPQKEATKDRFLKRVLSIFHRYKR